MSETDAKLLLASVPYIWQLEKVFAIEYLEALGVELGLCEKAKRRCIANLLRATTCCSEWIYL